MKKTIAEQIKDLENTRAAKAARMQEIANVATEAGRSMDVAEAEEFDTIDGEVKTIDADLVRMKRLEQLNANAAVPVAGANADEGTSSRTTAAVPGGPTIIIAPKDKAEKFKGQNFTRIAIAKALSHLDKRPAWAIADERWGKTNPTLVAIIKANEVAGGGTGSGEWGAELAASDSRYTGDFIEYLYAMTAFDKLPLRQIPANVFIKGQDGTATGYWVGESKPIPASKADFSDVELRELEVGALAVVSNRLLRSSSPDAEALVRDSLVNASAQRVDTTFFSTAGAVSGVSPAGILNGLSGLASSGADAAGLLKDIENLYRPFIAAYNASGLWFVMSTSLAKSISLLRNALSQKDFPEMRASGGVLEGDNAVSGDNVHSDWLILLKPSDIYRIGDSGVQVSISGDAMIEQSSAPTGATDTPVAATQAFTSMFQSNSTAIKVVRQINFAKRRASAVAYINDADYNASDSP